jgi:hypothetical protein
VMKKKVLGRPEACPHPSTAAQSNYEDFSENIRETFGFQDPGHEILLPQKSRTLTMCYAHRLHI